MRIAFAGGGTGGHVVPGLHLVARALADDAALSATPAIDDLLWFTSGRSVEERLLGDFTPPFPFERRVLELEPSGGGAPSLTRLGTRTPRAFLAARRALAQHESQVLVGLGGFTTLPAALAARSLGVPVALLEINAAPGRATRVLSRLATRVFHAWRGTLPPAGESARERLVGAPVAPEVTRVSDELDAVHAAREALGFAPEAPLLVVLGGSQGAGSLNGFLRENAQALRAAGLQVLHQCGPGRRAEAPDEQPGLRVVEFLSPVAPALQAATLVLCRGGASTLAEVAAARRPAIVVPYPHHADRHQERNARELGEGVRIVADDALDASLVAELLELAGDHGVEARRAMSVALKDCAAHDAAGALLRELGDLAAGDQESPPS